LFFGLFAVVFDHVGFRGIFLMFLAIFGIISIVLTRLYHQVCVLFDALSIIIACKGSEKSSNYWGCYFSNCCCRRRARY
jgi:hypothetical protein